MKFKEKIQKTLITRERDLGVTKALLQKKLFLYNGKTIIPLKINPKFIGTKLGTFAPTKALGRKIHNSERNRKRKAKKKK